MKHDEWRRLARLEGSLILLFVLPLLLAGMGLVVAGRLANTPSTGLMLNECGRDTLAGALNISPNQAQRIVDYRARVGPFADDDSLGRIPALLPGERVKLEWAAKQGKVDLNSTDAKGISLAANLPRWTAQRLVEYREDLRAAQRRNVKSILAAPLLQSNQVREASRSFIVRPRSLVLLRAFIAIALSAALFIGLPVIVRRKRKYGSPFLFPIVEALLVLGWMAVFTIKDPLRDAPSWERHVLAGWASLIVMACVAALGSVMGESGRSIQRWRQSISRYSYLWAIAAAGLIALLLVFAPLTHGARLSLGVFQPVELVKLLLVLFIASYMVDRDDLLDINASSKKGQSSRHRRLKDVWLRSGPLLVLVSLCLLLFVTVRDQGPALTLLLMTSVWMAAATGRLLPLVVSIGLIIVGMAAVKAAGIGVLPVRVDMWRSPFENPHPGGMQLGQALWSLASSSWIGAGPGLGSAGLTPRAGSDLVFATVVEESGLLGGCLVLGCLTLISLEALRIARRARTALDAQLAVGLGCLLACQSLLQVAGVIGLLPLTGITLPFVSFGASSLIISGLMLGLLYGISAELAGDTCAVPARLDRSMPTVAAGTAFLMIGVLGLRLIWLTGIADERIASKTIRTPDADGIARAKVNPRLLFMERSIARGSILDRNGAVLASGSAENRLYPHGDLAAHWIGYSRADAGGPVGWEREFKGELRGFADYAALVSKYRRKELPGWLGGGVPGRGADLRTTLDLGLQQVAEAALNRAVQRRDQAFPETKSKGAALVVLDPSTGEVLAGASYPVFDPATVTLRQVNEARPEGGSPFVNRVTNGWYPPGSTLKIATAALLLETGQSHSIQCNHEMKNLRWRYQVGTFARAKLVDDLHDPPHGKVGLELAFAKSCNLYFGTGAVKIGAHSLFEGLTRFGFSKTPQVGDLALELPDIGYGQGKMLASPMEMAQLVGAVANGGLLTEPRTRLDATAPASVRVISEGAARSIAKLMASVTQVGTARGVFDALPYRVAGKTGTAQTSRGKSQPHSWFVGFAPASRPRYAFACIIENGGYGKTSAAPCIADFLKRTSASR